MISKLVNPHNDSQTNYDAIKYSGITIAVAVIHIVFLILFFIMRVYPMCIYNVFAITLYLIICSKISSIKNYQSVYLIYLFEVILHSTLATLMCGWDCGFMYYTIAFIPVSFYVTFTIESFKKKLFYPFFTFGFVLFSYIIMKCISYYIDPFYQSFNRGFTVFLYYINVVIGLFATFMFSALFALENASMQMMLKDETQSLEEKANFDPLTHFLNRRSMTERLNQAHKNALINDVSYSLIMSDIDFFKKFNDTYGHDCGDYVLQTIAKIIQAQIRNKDSACRWGGEEFLLLINENLDTAAEVAERIRKSVETYDFYYEGQTLHVTLTLGVSSYYTSSKVKTLIEIADKRLYKGKENGRNQVVVS